MNLVPAEAEKNIRTAVADKEQVLTGFHAIEERIRKVPEEKGSAARLHLFYNNPGPRVKKIIDLARKVGILSIKECDAKELDATVKGLPEVARDHRGIVLVISGEVAEAGNSVDFDLWLAALPVNWLDEDKKADSRQTVFILDSVTDPHNVGAILRSADQFGVSLVLLPERRGVNDFSGNEVIARTSAGASSWIKVSVVSNLVRAVKQLKEAGFWIYGADAGGLSVNSIRFNDRTAVVMGSEGSGISQLLRKQCDGVVSIPTCGRIDSLNVSVAAGILMYEIYRQNLPPMQLKSE